MLKILNVVGARPQIIKAAAISREIKNHFGDKIKEVILHTGQHYDDLMSQVFFDEMGIPPVDFNLNVGSSSHAVQTAQIMQGAEQILLNEKPDFVFVYGDTNSTLAVSIAAAKLHFRVVHIEAGLRSFNKSMPEEINRIVCDHVSSILFTPTWKGLENLKREGFSAETKSPFSMNNPGVFHCGDIMYDNSLYYSELASGKTTILQDLSLKGGDFILLTVHRDMNTDNPARLKEISEAMLEIAGKMKCKVLFPLHPRTRKNIESEIHRETYKKLQNSDKIILHRPLSFFEMIEAEKACKLVITDSGGVQKEAFFFRKPSIILRKETEWVEIVECGAAHLTGTSQGEIIKAAEHFLSSPDLNFPSIFGNGRAAHFICNKLLENT